MDALLCIHSVVTHGGENYFKWGEGGKNILSIIKQITIQQKTLWGQDVAKGKLCTLATSSPLEVF